MDVTVLRHQRRNRSIELVRRRVDALIDDVNETRGTGETKARGTDLETKTCSALDLLLLPRVIITSHPGQRAAPGSSCRSADGE